MAIQNAEDMAERMKGVKRLTTDEVKRVNELLDKFRGEMRRNDFDAADETNGELLKATWKKCVSWDCPRNEIDWAMGTGHVVHYDDPRKVSSFFYV